MPVNWQDPDVKDRILASIIASFGGSINCKEVSRIFGPDATYDAIENFLRKPKKKAKELRAEADKRGDVPTVPKQQRTPRKNKEPGTPKKADGVKTGRISKNTPKKPGPLFKKEVVDELDNTMLDAEVPASDYDMMEGDMV